MRFLNLTLRIFGFLIALVVAIPLLLIAILQVPSGRSLVSNVVSSIASSETQTIRIEGLYLSFGLNAAVEGITLSDPEGVWFEAKQIGLDWHPLQLLSGTLDVAALTADRMDLNRLPVSEPAPSSEGESETGEQSEGLALPLDFSVSELALREINIGSPVIGEPVSVSVAGSGAFVRDPALVSGKLDVQRVDGIDAKLNASAEFEPSAETLAFDLVLSAVGFWFGSYIN
ncbi:MAG: hypothetical protein AAFN16_17210, partial [Pseudomonadota bacterium]